MPIAVCFFFFFNDTATTEIYTLSLHDALPIYCTVPPLPAPERAYHVGTVLRDVLRAYPGDDRIADRKSTRLNSSHDQISYAVFCLKKKKKTTRRFVAPVSEGHSHLTESFTLHM